MVTRINEEVIDIVAMEVKRGLPIELACQAAGISKGQYNTWKKKGGLEPEASKSLYRVFYDEVIKAEALSAAYRVENIRKQEEAGNWRASAWMLERRFPEHFGKKSVIDANVEANIATVDLSELFSKDQLENILDEDLEDDGLEEE